MRGEANGHWSRWAPGEKYSISLPEVHAVFCNRGAKMAKIEVMQIDKTLNISDIQLLMLRALT